jgi:hypothetical protein
VRYRIHPGVVEVIQAATPEPVTAAVDAQLAAWWTAVVGGWAGIEPQHAGMDTNQFMLRASVAQPATCYVNTTGTPPVASSNAP